MYKFLITFCIIALASLNYSSYGQTTTIDYDNLTLQSNQNDCNIFDPQITVNGINHRAHAGGVSLSSNGIDLFTIPGSSKKGTAYYLEYNFTAGSTYNIAITTVNGSNHIQLNTTVVINLNAFQTNGSTTCTPDANVTTYGQVSGSFGYKEFTVDGPEETHNVDEFTIPTGTATYPYLVIYAQDINSNLSLDNFTIKKIVITKTAAVSFTLSPQSVIGTCGTIGQQTFTVSNDNNSPGTLSYSWNLGSSTNGWNYNGSPAPQTFTTSTNSITLTPTCGSPLSSVSVTTSVVGTSISRTSNAPVTVSAANSQMVGNDVICTENSYSLSNVPCNTTVTWNVQQHTPSIVTQSTSGNNITLTKTGSGWLTLTGTYTSCGQTVSKQLIIRVGSYHPGTFAINGPTNIMCGDVATYSVGVQTGVSYNWTYPSGYNLINNGGNTNSVTIQSPWNESVGGDVNVYVTDACGTVHSYLYVYSDCYYMYSVSPNPASSSIEVKVSDRGKQNVKNRRTITIVRIFDQLGNLKLERKFGRVPQANIDISRLPLGYYVIEIGDDINNERQKLSVIK